MEKDKKNVTIFGITIPVGLVVTAIIAVVVYMIMKNRVPRWRRGAVKVMH